MGGPYGFQRPWVDYAFVDKGSVIYILYNDHSGLNQDGQIKKKGLMYFRLFENTLSVAPQRVK